MKKIITIAFILLMECFFISPGKSIENKGLLIAALGLPGSGKSSIIKELKDLCQAEAFFEPPEENWPISYKLTFELKEIPSQITTHTWFRSVNTSSLYYADFLRKQGKLVLLEPYYDKILFACLGKPGFQFVFPPQDPYYEVVYMLAKKDWDFLPNADYVIFFEINYSTWRSFLLKRNRPTDKDPLFLEIFTAQKTIWEALKKVSKEKGIKIIKYKVKSTSPKENAKVLYNILLQKGILKYCPHKAMK